MLEKLSKRLVPIGRAHSWLQWPILGLLMLVWGLDCAWVFARRLGKEIWAVVREAGAHLREAGLTPQGIHDHAEYFLDAGIAAAKKLPPMWKKVKQEGLPLAMARGRSVVHTSAQWFLARCQGLKATLLLCGTRLKTAGGKLSVSVRRGLDRLISCVRADLPEYKRHAPRRAMAAALALVMCLGMLPVSAFAAEADCTHVHDAACYRQELTCGKEESEGHAHGEDCSAETQTCTLPEHTHGDACMTDGVLTCTETEHTHDAACVESGLTCDKAETEAHAHGADCYNEVLDCKHVHDETCNGLEEIAPACDCGAVPDADGNTVHAEGCPLYTALVVVCATCAEAHDVADCPVEAVRVLIAALPTPEDISAMTEVEREASGAYGKMEAAYNAYDALTDAQKALLPDAMDTFTALQAALLGAPMLMTLAEVVPISSAADLKALADAINSDSTSLTVSGGTYTIAKGGAGTTFTLKNDIDLYTCNPWTPIGKDNNHPFVGVFDGGNHTISDMTVNIQEGGYIYAGLFGYISGNAVIHDVHIGADSSVTVTSPSISTESVWAGGIVGYVYGDGDAQIYNCTSSATVSATELGELVYSLPNVYVGGIAGEFSGELFNCANSGAVTVAGWLNGCIGGIAGIGLGFLENCFNTGAVSSNISGGSTDVGGIAGSAKETVDYSRCYYLESTAAQGIDDNYDDVTGSKEFPPYYQPKSKAASDMKSNTFVATLNRWVTRAPYREWVAQPGSYPTPGDVFGTPKKTTNYTIAAKGDGFNVLRIMSTGDPISVGADGQKFQEALDAIKKDAGEKTAVTIKLLSDVNTVAEALPTSMSSPDTTLDLNGHTWTADRITVYDRKLTVKDDSLSSTPGGITSSNNIYDQPLIQLYYDSQFTLQSGALEQTGGNSVIVDALGYGIINIEGGTVENSGTSDDPQSAITTKGTLIITGGAVYCDVAAPVVSMWEDGTLALSGRPTILSYSEGQAAIAMGDQNTISARVGGVSYSGDLLNIAYRISSSSADGDAVVTNVPSREVAALFYLASPSGKMLTYDGESQTLKLDTKREAVNINWRYKAVSYDGVGVDVSKVGMFDIPQEAGTATYTVVNGTGQGTFNGTMLTVTRFGYFDVTVNTAQTATHQAGYATARLYVNSPALTVIPDAVSKIIGDPDPVLTYTVIGAGDDVMAHITGALTRIEGESLGTYTIRLGTLKLVDGDGFWAADYTLKLSETPVKFTINPKPRTIAAPSAQSTTTDSVVLKPVTPSMGSGLVEYAKNTVNEAPTASTAWSERAGFYYLEPGTTYYFFARVGGDGYYADAVSAGAAITTTAKAVTRIEITSQPRYKKYDAYAKLNTTDMVVTAYYNDYTSAVITDYAIVYPDNRDSFRVGNTWVWLTYGGQMCKLEGLTVNAVTVPVPTIASKEYNGTLQTADVPEDERYTIENTGGTDAGKYNVVLTLEDTRNCQWSDGTTAPKTLTFNIKKSTNPWITQPSCADIVFGETPNPIAKPTFGAETMTVTYALKDTWTEYPKPDKVGTWKATFRVPETANYVSRYLEVEFEVSKKPYSETVFTIDPIPDQTWTGSSLYPKPVVKCGETELVEGSFNAGDYYTAYLNNNKVGTATINIYFRGNYTGTATTTFQIVNAKLPEGTTNDSIFRLSATELMKWHNEDFYLGTKDNWQVLNSYGNYGTYVTLSTESTKDADGKIVPSSMDLQVKNEKTGKVYETTVTYLLDKVAPVITVDGMGEDGVNKIWGSEKTITIHITDALSGVRYVNIVGQDASTLIQYGDPDIDPTYHPLPEDGVYTYTVQANDIYSITAYDNADNQPFWGVGNDELPTFVVEKIDREKPTATFGEITGTAGENGWLTGTVTVNVNIADPETVPDDESTVAINESNKSGIAKWEYSIDGGTTWTEMAAEATSFPIDASGDYTDKLQLRATDNAGNVSEIATASVKLDKTAPVVSLSMTAGGAAYDGAAFTAHNVVITPSNTASNLSGVTYYYQKTGDTEKTKLDGNTLTVDFNCDTQFTFTAVSGAGVESGTQTVTVKRSAMSAEELAKTEYGEGDFTVSPDKSGDWYTELPTVTVTPKDTVGVDGLDATTYYELYKAPAESGSKTELTDPYTIKPTEDGIWTLKIWTEDEAGNKTNPHTIILQVDTTKPTITDVADNPTDWVHDAAITFKAEDATSGVKSVVVTCDDNKDVTYTDGGFTADRNGTYTITVTDKAGNTHTETVVVDKIDKATLATPTVTGYTTDTWVNEDISFALATTDTTANVPSGVSFQVKVGDGDWAVIETPYAVTQNTDGVVYQFRTVSGAGAVSEAVEFVVKLDQTPPVITTEATAGGASYTGAATAHDVVITLGNTAANISGTTYYYQKTGDADWTKLDGNVLTVDFNCDTSFIFKAISGAGVESGTQTVAVKRSAMSAEELAKTEYGAGDFTVSPDKSGDWYTELPTVTVMPKDTVGVGGLPATTYYELYKSPDESETKTRLTDPWTISPAEDGIWTLKVWTEDAAGNKTNPYTIILQVDTTDPTISEPAGNPTQWQSADAAITFTAADATSGVKSVVVTCDDGADVTFTDGGFTADRNGTYTITVTDKAGNIATKEVVVTKIDKQKPAAPTVTGYISDTWVNSSISFALSTTDTVATIPSGVSFQVKVGDGEWAATEATYPVTKNTNSVAYQFRVISGTGVPSETVDFTVKLDQTVPVITTAVTAGGAAYDGQSFTAHDVVITLGNSADNISGTTYYYQKTGDAQWTELDGSVLTVDYNCTATFTFKAVSGAALESSNQPTAQVKRNAMSEEQLAETEYGESDLTVSPDKSGDWYTELPTVTVTPKDTVGVDGLEATTYYELYKSPAESGDKTKLTAPWSIKPTGDGIWTLKVWTEDAAGNKTKPYTITLMVDTTAPTLTDVTGNATSWQKTDVTLAVNGAADATSGLAEQAYSFDGGATWQVSNEKTFAANATVTVWVRDKAGNTYKHAPIVISKIDKTAPVVAWDADAAKLDANKWYGKTALTATATDDSGEAPAITLTSGGKTYENGATIDKNGTYSFTAIAKDGAGNVGRSTVLTLRVETAIDVFVDMVDALDENSDYQDILNAKTWYDNQSSTIRDHLSKSDAAQEAYEKLLSLLRDKAQEAAAGVTDAIKNADTVEEIKQAAKDYDALPDEAKDKVPGDVKKELDEKKKDADAAQKVIDQLANADRPKTDKDPGGSYEEKQAAQEAYDKLTDSQKELVNKETGAVEDKSNIDTDLTAIDGVLDLLKDIKKPYTPATKDQITAAKDAYDSLTDKQKDAFPKSDKAKLDALVVMRDHAQAVEDKISALGDSPSQAELNAAKGAHSALTADEKAMVDGALKTELDKKYQDMLDQLGADDKAAAEFAAKVEEVKNAPSVEKIEQLIKGHDALSDAAKEKLSEQTKQDYQDLVDTLNKVKDVIDKLDKIDPGKLTPDDLDEIKDVLDRYDDLDETEQKLVDDATNGKPGILDEAIKGTEDAAGKIESIPSDGEDHSLPTDPNDPTSGGSNMGECGDESHTYEDHRNAIEEAKIAYEKLTDAGRKLISDAAKEKLNREYAALMAYLEYVNTAKTTSTKVEVAGLAEKVELPPESATAGKTVVAVVMKDEKPAVMPPLPAGKSEALSVDIKLVASIYNDAADTAPAATETVQPESGKKVLVKLLLPTGYKLDTLEIWHVKDSGGRSRIQDFWQVTESDGTYAVFEVSSFSHFVFFAEKTPTGGTGGGTVTPTPKPDVPSTDHGSTTINPQQPRPGTTVTISPKPDEGYVVDKVIVTDQSGKELPVKDNGDGTYSYTQPNGKVTVTVTFKPATKDNEFPFTDVTESDWFYESVKYVYEKGLMVGTSDTTFSPNLSTSRGMIITILWRLEGEPGAKAAALFADVAADKYYAQAVAWGAENGIVKGYGNGSYGPDDLITREQLAAILYRYAQFKGMDTGATGDLTQFTDQPSAWAAESVRWAVGAGIISGKGNGILDPTGNATRAQAAAMLFRFCERTTNPE